MNIILAFDKFKGSMTSAEAARAAADGIRAAGCEAALYTVPAADGGEGTMEAFLSALGGKTEMCTVTHPRLTNSMCIDTHIKAEYALTEDKDGLCAIMEMAQASGLELVPKSERNPLYTTTYGTGEMIRDALDHGCRRFLIGIGGSATNDAGCGMAAALGVRFYDTDGRLIPYPTGGTLLDIARIDTGDLDPRVKESTFTVCCDVDNPLCGPTGAAYIYAPQKGADPETVKYLDTGLAHIAERFILDCGADQTIAAMPGAGAAGGLGAGMKVFLGGTLTPGAEAVMDACGLDNLLENADLLLTGEGKLDGQTVHGKTVAGFLRRAKAKNVPVVAFGGCVTKEAGELYAHGITAIFPLASGPMTLEDSMREAPNLLRDRVRAVMSLVRTTK